MGQVLHEIGDAALTWLPLIFFGMLIYLLWRVVQLMPRISPAEGPTGSSSEVGFDDVAGLWEVKEELQLPLTQR